MAGTENGPREKGSEDVRNVELIQKRVWGRDGDRSWAKLKLSMWSRIIIIIVIMLLFTIALWSFPGMLRSILRRQTRRSNADPSGRLLRLRVRILPSVLEVSLMRVVWCAVTSVCDGPIPCPEQSYRVRACVCVCVWSSVIRCKSNPLHLQWLGRRGPILKNK